MVSKVKSRTWIWSILLKIPMFQSDTFQLIDIEKELVKKRKEWKYERKMIEKRRFA